ncbi:MAG: glycosyltransferase family 2 protein [Minisyncoccia bacterium]
MDNNIKTKVSIVIITRNRAIFIIKAIQSVLDQTLYNWELLIGDDDSKDDTEKIVREFSNKDNRIKYFKNSPALGISKNRNKALSLVTGKYISILDSDDSWIDKEKIQTQFSFLENNPDYVLIGSNIKVIDEKNNFIRNTDFSTEDADIRKKILITNQIPHSSVMYRKDIAEKVGRYNENLSCDEDLDLFLRLGLLGKMKNLTEITTSYTKHSKGFSQQQKISMAWNHFIIILRNFGKYPNWFIAIVWAKFRILKNLF